MPPKLKIQQGGLEITTELSYGLALNSILRGATRILLRLKTQKCRDYPKLFNIIRKYPWKSFLKQETNEFITNSHRSRLQNTGKIANVAMDGLKAYFQANHIKTKDRNLNLPPQKIYLRLDEDNLSIALDTSGELLHKRSSLSFRGHASLRENYAALLLWLQLDPIQDYSKLSLYDPMCGTGTFIREAINAGSLVKRKFAYHNWNLSLEEHQLNDISVWNFKDYNACDIDPKLKRKVQDLNLKTKDFFKDQLHSDHILITNSPYGKRIKIQHSPAAYFKELIHKVQTNPHTKQFGVIIPQEQAKSLKGLQKKSFNQNGIKVTFVSNS